MSESGKLLNKPQPMMTLQKLAFPLFLALVIPGPSSDAGELQPILTRKGEKVLSEDFQSDLPRKWTIQFGSWTAEDGVLKAYEKKEDKHAAAARLVQPMQDGIHALRFRLQGECKAFHYGFDPAPGTLKKKGHLFSVIISPKDVKLMKHVDKARPKEDPNEVLATAGHEFQPGAWYRMLLEKKGNEVALQIIPESGQAHLELHASHPTFHVPTPTLVFRCQGASVEVDDVQVWKALPDSSK